MRNRRTDDDFDDHRRIAGPAGSGDEAEQIKLIGDARAQALEKAGAALAKNPKLVEYEYATRWGGVMPTLMPSDKVPMLMQMPNVPTR